MWRYLNANRDKTAALMDRDGIIRQTRRVGDPVAFDTTAFPARLFMSKATGQQFDAQIRAALDYGHASRLNAPFFAGRRVVPQHYSLLPYSPGLMAVVCFRVF